MGWPKGMKRKGHVNKDGTTHAKRGSKLKAVERKDRPTNGKQTPAQRTPVATALRPARGGESLPEGVTPWEVKPEWKGLLRWTGNNPPWTAFCPNCGFPEADGGYCPGCGWTTAITYSNK